MTAKILIVEDEPDLAALVADYLRAAGHGAQTVGDGREALTLVQRATPDLIVLDLMLPGLDGVSLCREVRRFSDVPIVMTTAKVEEIDRLLGLQVGADDYVCKPYSPRELVARIAAILRRRRAPDVPARLVGIDEAGRRAHIGATLLPLTATEFGVLAALARRPGVILSRAQLLDLVRGDDLDVTDRAIDSHIKNLRRKIAAVLPDAEVIHSVYGLGYRFE